MNCFNQQYAGETRTGGQNGQASMPAWQGQQGGNEMFEWQPSAMPRMPRSAMPAMPGMPGMPGMPEMDCGMPPSTIPSMENNMKTFPDNAMQQPIRQPAPRPMPQPGQQSMPQPGLRPMPQPMSQPAPRPMPRPMQEPMDFATKMEGGMFPLGMSYVPIQRWSQPSSLEDGFRRGTMFSELDLPFMMGRCQ